MLFQNPQPSNMPIRNVRPWYNEVRWLYPDLMLQTGLLRQVCWLTRLLYSKRSKKWTMPYNKCTADWVVNTSLLQKKRIGTHCQLIIIADNSVKLIRKQSDSSQTEPNACMIIRIVLVVCCFKEIRVFTR